MDLSIYFAELEDIPTFRNGSLGAFTEFNTENNFPELEKVDVAIFSVKESRGGAGQKVDFNPVRESFYHLFFHQEISVVDLGDILSGENVSDTYHAVSEVIQELNKRNIFTIVLGGSQDLTFAQYRGYEKLEQTVNLAVLDHSIDVTETPADAVSNKNFLSSIVMHIPNYLFNCSVLGYQSYFVSPAQLQLMKDLYFDVHRIGEFQKKIYHSESIVRNADMLSVDLNVIRQSEFKGRTETSANGLYGEEICQIFRYAGMSDKLTSIGLFEYDYTKDEDRGSAQLIAQMLWCLLEGLLQRKGDFPKGTKEDYLKFRVHIDESDHELVFFKSNLTERWWMQVPYPPDQFFKFERHHMVPCNYEDYEMASKGIMPDIWWKTYQKLN